MTCVSATKIIDLFDFLHIANNATYVLINFQVLTIVISYIHCRSNNYLLCKHSEVTKLSSVFFSTPPTLTVIKLIKIVSILAIKVYYIQYRH